MRIERSAEVLPKRKRIGSSETENDSRTNKEGGREGEEAREGDKVAADGIEPVVYGSPHVYH